MGKWGPFICITYGNFSPSPFLLEKAFRVQPYTREKRSSDSSCRGCHHSASGVAMHLGGPVLGLSTCIYSPSNEQPPSSLHRGSALCSQRLLLAHPECWLQIPPLLFSALRSPHGAEAPARSSPEPFPAGAGAGKGRLPFPAGRWELLHSSCVSCPQLSIAARNAGDGSVLEMERLRLNGSVTEHRLPEHSPGRSYAVMIQGLTAAGAGTALTREFHTGSSGKLCCVAVPGAWAQRSCARQPALPDAAPAPRTALPVLTPRVFPSRHAAPPGHQLPQRPRHRPIPRDGRAPPAPRRPSL